MHSLAVVTIGGPSETMRELTHLLSRQRLAAVRHGPDEITVVVRLEDGIDFSRRI